jgi:hypothetical protein
MLIDADLASREPWNLCHLYDRLGDVTKRELDTHTLAQELKESV